MAVLPWVSYLPSLCFSFPVFKMGIMKKTTHSYEIKPVNMHKELKTEAAGCGPSLLAPQGGSCLSQPGLACSASWKVNTGGCQLKGQHGRFPSELPMDKGHFGPWDLSSVLFCLLHRGLPFLACRVGGLWAAGHFLLSHPAGPSLLASAPRFLAGGARHPERFLFWGHRK